MEVGVDAELQAWRWLLALPRIDWQKHTPRQMDRQVLVWVTPGRLYASSGAPMIHVSVKHPGRPKRFRASGNSLADAVNELHVIMWTAGIETPFPQFLGGVVRMGAGLS